jgi:hypothetical protein
MPTGGNVLLSGMNCWLERRPKVSMGRTPPCPSKPLKILPGMGWPEAADLIVQALTQTIAQGPVTYDLARQIQGAREVKCSEFGAAIRENIQREAG